MTYELLTVTRLPRHKSSGYGAAGTGPIPLRVSHSQRDIVPTLKIMGCWYSIEDKAFNSDLHSDHGNPVIVP